VLYILMSLTMVGLTPYPTLNVDNPVTIAIQAAGPQLLWLEWIVDVGAVAGLTTVILVSLYGQTRIFYSMARDGMLPPVFAAVHPTYNTPARGTILVGIFAAFLGGVFPIDILGELVSIGTLLAFVLVCLGVIVLRVQRPDVPRPFKTPFSPVTPILGILVCGAMMYGLPGDTWIRLGIWFLVGMLIFALYGIRHAKQPSWTLWDDGKK
jgi:APA family basic amino acid/polyamine antiporter